ncbi:MAG: bifunctional methylenetetrahydrofolate dehydrogenase/methenyltetrahydrofolate cyclohydrolase FolD [Candidatus Izemoplasma sp.]|nr:bifunctional methylenetetrahydrofolate dehydrogenase/methenyltetrahydrofolate cyclohydrolase FolD [Candidatus Izemoplasma sp.]
MAEIISGKTLSKAIRSEVKKDVTSAIEKYGKTPHLVVVLVGDDPASQSYVRAKKRACEKAGIRSTTILKSETITEEDLLNIVSDLNNDEDVHGILVQLPLPDHINEDTIIDAIDIRKDVDGFHPLNIAYLHLGRDAIVPATPKGILTMLKSVDLEIEGKDVLVIGRSNIVGKPVSALLTRHNATVTLAHSRTKNLKMKSQRADIIIAAVGRPKMVTADMVKDGAVVIDVGVNRVDGKLVGDVDFDAISKKAKYITPVPGGVGPMTITSLLQNTLICYERIMKND